MAEIGTAFVSILPEARGFTKKLDGQIAAGMGRSGRKAGLSFGKAFGAVAALGIGAKVVGFLGDSLEEAREAQKVGAQTANVIKSMGLASKVTATQIGDFATKLSNATGVDDELIQSSENTLLTFGNLAKSAGVTGGAFQQAAGLALDMSTALGTDLKGATIQVGKALNDPVKGVTALGRAGVSFTDQQKEQIKTLVESGKVTAAQKIVLGELSKEFKGSAEAQATAGDKAKTALGNIKEAFGLKVTVPVVDALSNAFLKVAPSILRFVDGIGPAFSRAQSFLAPFVTQVQGFFGGAGGGGGFTSGLQTVVGILQSTFLPILQQAAATFRNVVLPAVTSLVSYVAKSLLPVLQQVAGIVVGQVLPIFQSLALFLYGKVYPALVDIATSVAQSLKPAFDQLIATVQSQVLPAVSKLLALFRKYQPQIQQVVLFLLKLYGSFLKVYTAVLGKVLPVLIKFVGFLVGRLVAGIVMYVESLAKGIRQAIAFGKAIGNAAQAVVRFATKVGEKIADVLRFFRDLPTKVTAALGDFKNLLVHAGEELMNGLVRGIKNKLAAVASAMKDVAAKVKGFLPGSPVKEGPLTSWNNGGAGERLMDMLAKGILSGKRKVTKALEKVLNKAKDQLDFLVDAFQSVMEGVKGNFAGGLFSGFDTAGAFVTNLTSVKGNLGNLIGDFATLKGFGLPPSFLAQLFADGGYKLIHDLASDQGQATAAADLFNDVQTLSSSLGNSVASTSTGVQTTLDRLLVEQQLTNQLLAKAPQETGDRVGNKVNKAGADGKRRGNNKAGKR